MVTDAVSLLLLVTGILEELGIEYVIGGSLASSQHGEVRATNDVDILVRLDADDVPTLVAALRPTFDMWEDSTTSAVKAGQSFSALHTAWHVKVDFFPLGPSLLDARQMARRQAVRFPQAPDRDVFFTTAEDTILRKLDWYRKSGGTLERQLRDVEGVLKLRAPNLDFTYLRSTAAEAGLDELLATALAAAGVSEG